MPRTAQRPNTRSLAALAKSVPNLVTDEGAVRYYIANIEMDITALGESVTIYLFDGAVSEEVKTWSSCANFLGKCPFLTARPENSTYNSSSGSGKVGSISMTDVLIDRAQSKRLGGLGDREVTWYLKKKLHWMVVKVVHPPSHKRLGVY
jgi:hypothetical protein